MQIVRISFAGMVIHSCDGISEMSHAEHDYFITYCWIFRGISWDFVEYTQHKFTSGDAAIRYNTTGRLCSLSLSLFDDFNEKGSAPSKCVRNLSEKLLPNKNE